MSISTLVGFRVIDRNVPEIVIRKGSVGYLNYRRVPGLAMQELQKLDLMERVNSGGLTESHLGSHTIKHATKQQRSG